MRGSLTDQDDRRRAAPTGHRVGEALNLSRDLYPGNGNDRKFGEWVAAKGFDMDVRDRAAAMWLAENWLDVSRVTPVTPTPGELGRIGQRRPAPLPGPGHLRPG